MKFELEQLKVVNLCVKAIRPHSPGGREKVMENVEIIRVGLLTLYP